MAAAAPAWIVNTLEGEPKAWAAQAVAETATTETPRPRLVEPTQAAVVVALSLLRTVRMVALA